MYKSEKKNNGRHLIVSGMCNYEDEQNNIEESRQTYESLQNREKLSE